jgi:hypothetical protein
MPTPPDPTPFGAFLTRRDVEEAVKGHLQAWAPKYIAEVSRQKGRTAPLPALRNWTVIATGFEKWTADQLPMVLIQSSGLAEPPKAEGNGKIRGKYLVGVAAIVSAGNDDDTRRLSGEYFAALRAIMLQHPGLGGVDEDGNPGEPFAQGVTWQDEQFDQIPSESERTLAAAYGIFAVEVANIVDRFAGISRLEGDPADPSPMPPDVDLEGSDVDVGVQVFGTRP